MDISSLGDLEPDSEQDPSSSKQSKDNYITSTYSFNKNLANYMNAEGSFSVIENYPGVERDQFDYAAERKTSSTATITISIMNLIRGCLGCGMLSIHEAYMNGGLWTSLVATLIIGSISSYCMMMMATSAQTLYMKLRVSKFTYAALIEAVVATTPLKCLRPFSKKLRYIADVLLVIHLCAMCCFYQIMIASTYKHVMEWMFDGIKKTNLPLRIYSLIVTIPLLSISLIKSLKRLAILSFIGNFLLGICMFGTIYYTITYAGTKERPIWKSFQGLVKFTGVCVYSVDGTAFILPVENNMARPNFVRVVVLYAMPTVLFFVTVIGFIGYWGWGETCTSPITLHLPMNMSVVVLHFIISMILTISFAVTIWVPFRIIWHYIGRHSNCKKHGPWERVYRSAFVLVIACCSVATPDIVAMMSLLGNLLLSNISFIIPAFVDWSVRWRDSHNRRRFLLNCFIVLFGLIMIGGEIYILIP